MEDTLGVHHPYFQAQLCRPVLILVLMEDTLGDLLRLRIRMPEMS